MISRLIKRTRTYRTLERNAADSAAAVNKLSAAMMEAEVLIGLLRGQIQELQHAPKKRK